MLWTYLLIALVLFVNLLIAMFSQSYAEVMARADAIWKQQRLAAILSYKHLHASPPPFNLLTLPPTLLYRRALPWCRKRFRKLRTPPRDVDPPEPASTDVRGAARAARWGGANRKVRPAAGGVGGGGGSGPGGGLGGGSGGRRDSFEKSATTFAAEKEDHNRGPFATLTFTAAKAQAVEERARRVFAFA